MISQKILTILDFSSSMFIKQEIKSPIPHYLFGRDFYFPLTVSSSPLSSSSISFEVGYSDLVESVGGSAAAQRTNFDDSANKGADLGSIDSVLTRPKKDKICLNQLRLYFFKFY